MAEVAVPAPAAAGAASPTLDDLMLSMDVVDTLRHQESLVARELNEDQREAELIERLRKIYRDQGIDVPDHIIKEGVSALKDSRFVYTPPKPGLATSLARLYVRRGRIGRIGGIIAVILMGGWLAYAALVIWPAQRGAEQARVEIAETLPRALDTVSGEIRAVAREPAATARADQLLADGRAALARRDADAARKALAELEALNAKLRLEYRLTVVSRPGEPSGVWRIPDRNSAARNYYLVVEALGADGRPISLPVKSEEDGSTRVVTKWGVRVGEPVFDAVRKDKSDDGILQRSLVGEKRRGMLDVDYAMPVMGGAITAW